MTFPEQPPQQPYGDGQQPMGYGQQPSPYGQPPSPYPYQPSMGYFAPPLPKHPSATVAMILGIVGLAGTVAFCGVTLLVSPFAWYFGAQALREIDADPGRYSGRSDANAGKVTGIIGTVLLVVAVIVIIVFVVVVLGTMPSTTYESDY